jgi:hypothetical protein
MMAVKTVELLLKAILQSTAPEARTCSRPGWLPTRNCHVILPTSDLQQSHGLEKPPNIQSEDSSEETIFGASE